MSEGEAVTAGDAKIATTGDAGTSGPWWTRSTVAAALTAVSTVLVAVAAFLSAQAASNSDDNYAAASLALTDANYFFEQGVDALIEELAAEGVEVDRVCVLGLIVEAAAARCGDIEELEELTAADPIIAAGGEAQATADEAFAVGLEESNKSVDYQAALVLFAVGLALSAWASLSDTSTRARLIFLVLALGSVVAGLVRLLTV